MGKGRAPGSDGGASDATRSGMSGWEESGRGLGGEEQGVGAKEEERNEQGAWYENEGRRREGEGRRRG